VSSRDQVLIFANPIAGRGQGLDIARRLDQRLRADGYDVHLLLKRADSIKPADLPADARAAIVIGGDGTLRTVANRLCAGCATDESRDAKPVRAAAGAGDAVVVGPPLLVVPLGTANLMGRHLGLNWSEDGIADEVSAAIAAHKVVTLDAGRADGQLFLLITGVGFDAAVVHELDRLRTGPIGYLDYVLPAALALRDYEYPSLRVTVDGREVWRPARAVAFVGNVREYGTGFPILPHARPDDGELDICVMPCRSPFDLARLFLRSLTGEHLREEGVVYLRGRHVLIESPGAARPVPVQIDGDAAGHTPIRIDLLPVRLPFIVR
jgi:diacylglycerol kinase (ATP)